jgi:predicted nucleic acid-binding protein
MDYVIDANILMSMLISGKSSYLTLSRYYHFHLPAYALWELETYQDFVFAKSRLQPQQIRDFARDLFFRLKVYPALVIEPEKLAQADTLTSNIDRKDRDFLALALQLDLVLLSRDKPLVKGVKKKGYKKIRLFDEFLKNI